MQRTFKHCLLLSLTLLIATGCSALDPWKDHPFVAAHLTPENAVVTSSGYATIVEVEPPPLARDSIANVYQIAPTRHTLTVKHAASEEHKAVGVTTREVTATYARCFLTFDFQPGKLYHVKKASLNDAGELQLFYGKDRGVWLTEHNSDRPLAQCK